MRRVAGEGKTSLGMLPARALAPTCYSLCLLTRKSYAGGEHPERCFRKGVILGVNTLTTTSTLRTIRHPYLPML
eukprot:1158205-Pelagomonas_calceolata.AAC.6